MKRTVIKFYSNGCGPCKVYAPTFEKVKQELESEEIIFTEVNVEQDTEGLAGKYRVRGIPHTVILEDGEITHQQSGRLAEEQLKELILN